MCPISQREGWAGDGAVFDLRTWFYIKLTNEEGTKAQLHE